MAAWSDPDGDGVYQLSNNTDGIDAKTVRGETGDFDSVSTEEGPRKILNASSGQVQSKIDKVADNSDRGIVRLDAGEEYDPASTIRVREKVTLKFNDADLVPTTNPDLIEI